jgi:hypothetical protein
MNIAKYLSTANTAISNIYRRPRSFLDPAQSVNILLICCVAVAIFAPPNSALRAEQNEMLARVA